MADYKKQFKRPPKPAISSKADADRLLAKHDVPIYTEPRCSVCKHPHRSTIEKAIVLGTPYIEVARRFDLDNRAVSAHEKKHMNYEEEAIRRITQLEAERLRENAEEGVHGALSRRAYLSAALYRAWEGVIDGSVEVEPKDAVAIIDKLDKLDKETDTAQVEELKIQFHAFLQAVKEIVPNEQWGRIQARTHELLPAAYRPEQPAIEGSISD